MLIQRINRTDAEKVFINVTNREGATATTGMGLRFMGAIGVEGASADGTNCVLTLANPDLWQLAGVAAQDIPNDSAGLVQSWGYVDSVALSNVGSNVTLSILTTAETFLEAGGTAGMFTSTLAPQAISTMGYKYLQLMNTAGNISALSWGTAFIRAL